MKLKALILFNIHLFLLSLFTLTSATTVFGQDEELRIECIMIGQTGIFDIGKACEVSMDRCEEWIKEIGKATGIPVNITRIDDKDYNKNFISSYLDNLKYDVPENTIIVFYGTGHGFNYRENVLKYPVFAVDPNRKQLTKSEFNSLKLSLQSDIHSKLLSTGARFVLTIGELCNGLEDLPVPEEYRVMSGCTENYAELFREIRGDIIAASSERGKLSYTSSLTGGVFFGAFIRAFHESVDDCSSTPNWGSILASAQRNTNAINKQAPIYDVGYIDSAPEIIAEDSPKKRTSTRTKSRLNFAKSERFKGGEKITAPRITYSKN